MKTKQVDTDLAFILAQECPLLDDDMKWTAVELMYTGLISKNQLSQMLGVKLSDLDQELTNYDYTGGYN